MEPIFAQSTSIDDPMPLPGPLYPDRCLECPELLSETYGGVEGSRCVLCVTADRRRRGHRFADAGPTAASD